MDFLIPEALLVIPWIEPQIVVAGIVDYRHPVVIIAVIAFGTFVRIAELFTQVSRFPAIPEPSGSNNSPSHTSKQNGCYVFPVFCRP